MKSIREINLANKRILLRADYNEPIENGILREDERLKSSLKTLRYILDQKPGMFLILAHAGRPDGKRTESDSLLPIAKELERLLGREVKLLDNVEDIDRIFENTGTVSPVYLLENIRFWPEEETGDEEFSKKIAEKFDVYVNDGFSVSHRAHASVSVMPKYVKEKCAGLLFEEELVYLTKVCAHPDHPAVAIIGGSKIETKLPVINNLKEIYEKVLIGGMIANEALDQNYDLGENVLLPVDFGPEELKDNRLDIGQKTIEAFKNEIKKAKTIVWNGPLGKFEDEGCDKGTKEILAAVVANKEAYKVVGGGESLEAIEKFGNFSDFNYVSMSGGAMLEFLAGKKLPGIEALR